MVRLSKIIRMIQVFETLQIIDGKNDELLIDSDGDGVVDKFDLEQIHQQEYLLMILAVL